MDSPDIKEKLRRLKENLSAQPVKNGDIFQQMHKAVENWNPEKSDNEEIDERLNELKNLLRDIPAVDGYIIPIMRNCVVEWNPNEDEDGVGTVLWSATEL